MLAKPGLLETLPPQQYRLVNHEQGENLGIGFRATSYFLQDHRACNQAARADTKAVSAVGQETLDFAFGKGCQPGCHKNLLGVSRE